jgi:hypothetical protein
LYTPVIPALGRSRQEESNSRPTGQHRETPSQTMKTRKGNWFYTPGDRVKQYCSPDQQKPVNVFLWNDHRLPLANRTKTATVKLGSWESSMRPQSSLEGSGRKLGVPLLAQVKLVSNLLNF